MDFAPATRSTASGRGAEARHVRNPPSFDATPTTLDATDFNATNRAHTALYAREVTNLMQDRNHPQESRGGSPSPSGAGFALM